MELRRSKEHVNNRKRNPFTPRIRNFSLPRTRRPSHVKTYDESGDPEDHLKLFQSAAKTKEGLGKPTMCHHVHKLNLTEECQSWFEKQPKESIDSYEDQRQRSGKNFFSKQAISRIRWRYITSSKETENLRKTSWKGIRQKS
ncbi:hypothetical protein Tco_0512407 [Tanacetum coccineum]